MYAPGTVLELKKPRDPSPKVDRNEEVVYVKDKDGEPTDKPVMLEFPYNKVEVIGRSPVVREYSEWQGADAESVIIRPVTDFAGNLDEPLGKIRLLYKVVSVPDEVIPVERTIKVVEANTAQAGPTPEEVFAQAAPGKAPEKGKKRARTPFDDVHPAAGTQGTSPL